MAVADAVCRIYHLQENPDVTVVLVVQEMPETINEQVAKVFGNSIGPLNAYMPM